MQVRGVILGVKCRRHLGISATPLPNATLVVAILLKFSSILIMTLVLGDLRLFLLVQRLLEGSQCCSLNTYHLLLSYSVSWAYQQ